MWLRVVYLLVLFGAISATPAPLQGVETFWQEDACAVIELGDGSNAATLSWCVDKVVVTASGQLELAVSWRASGLAGRTLDKGSDSGNEKMYLVDNLGNRYDHIDTRGAAAEGGQLSHDHEVLHGVFVFPPPRLGAREFSFRDDDQHIVISGISSADASRSDRARSAAILGRVMQAESILIDYSWTGLEGQFQEGYLLRPTEGGFMAEAVRVDGAPVPDSAMLVPTSEVESFLVALAEAPVLLRDYVPRVLRPDDYPSITVELRMSRERIVFFTRSQGVGHAPWGVESGGEVYVIPDDTPARALQRLDPFLGRDLASRAIGFLEPHLGEARAGEIWAALDEELGTEDAYKTAFRLKDLLGREDDETVLASLEDYLERRRAPAEPVASAVLPDGDSRLVAAARDGDVATLESLLRRGFDPEERSELDGLTALMAASVADHADAVRSLLSAGADPGSRSRTGETALTLAAANNGIESLEALLEKGPEIDVDVKGRDGKTPLMQASEHGHAEVVAALLQAGASVDARSLRGSTPLGFAAENRHLPVVRLLLGAEADPNLANRYGETPLMRTLHPGIARALIRAGADVNAADEHGLTPVLRLALEEGPVNPDGGGPRPGAPIDRLGTLQALLAAGADANARDRQGNTALISSTNDVEAHPDLLRPLVAAGADPDARDSKGGTALVYASIHGHAESVRILIDAGADVNVRMGRTTPLGFALDHGHAEVVRLLLRAGAEP